jgi:osmotically-inducible protein OsmY
VKAISQINGSVGGQAHVNVTVFNRRVLLTGEVPDDASKQKAESVVRGINNVHAIVNELTVGAAGDFSSRTNDTYLEGRVKTALIAEKDLSANNFKVVAEGGAIYLMGLVTPDEGAQGANVASRVPGVTRVVKVFQYIEPSEAVAAAAAAASAPSASAPTAAAAPDDVTTGAVPDASVTSKPLDQQPPAPVSNSNVQPGSPQAVK